MAGSTTADRRGLHHEALIYVSDEEFLAAAVPFLEEGASNGEVTLLGVGPDLERLVLAEVGSEADVGLLRRGSDHEPLSALRATTALHDHLRGGATRVRLLGGIPDSPWPDWLRYEASVNHLFAATSLRGLCPYDARRIPGEVLDDVERTHPYVTAPGRASRRLAYEDPAALINGRNRAAGEELDRTAPGLELEDPSPTMARRTLEQIAHHTRLEDHDIDILCLCVAAILANARQHGTPPVRLRAWASSAQIDVTIRDAGTGPAEPFVGFLPRPGSDPNDPGTMHVVYEALSGVALYTDDDGFTVRLTQTRAA